MDARLWMARELLTATPDTALPEAARRMARRRVRHLLVVDAALPTKLVGVVSSHDLYLAAERGVNPFSARAVDDGDRTVAAIMTADPVTIEPSTPIAEAARLLGDRKFGCLPVVDRGVLVGVLTDHDILRAFVRWTAADQPGYEVTAVVETGRDVLADLGRLAAGGRLRLVSASSFEHDGRTLLVAHLAGGPDEAFVEALWRSGQSILRVRATGAATIQPSPGGLRAGRTSSRT